jgi:hypothetical protein
MRNFQSRSRIHRSNEHPIPNGEIRHVVLCLPDGSNIPAPCRLRTAYTAYGIITDYAVIPTKQEHLQLIPDWMITAYAGVKVHKSQVFKDPEKAAKAAFLKNLKRK